MAQHYARGSGSLEEEADEGADVTFTATASAAGSLLVGSSREFSGFDTGPSDAVTRAILHRAVGFLPGLAAVTPAHVAEVRVGLRPYSPSGPLLGRVPGTEGLFVAAGHEGSGLTLAPATAEILAAMLLQRTPPPHAEAFAPSPSKFERK